MNRRHLLAVWLLLGLLLAACQPPAGEQESTQEEVDAQAVAEQASDEVAEADQEEGSNLEGEEPDVAQPEIVEFEIGPISTTEDPSELAPEKLAYTPAVSPQEVVEVRDFDWTKGAEEGVITIIEYGDFQ